MKPRILYLLPLLIALLTAIATIPVEGAENPPARPLTENPSTTIPTYPEDIEFERVVLPGGLSSKMIQSMDQDQQGFLWIGTEGGLYKYDGYKFTLYQHDSPDSSYLTNDIEIVFIDSKNTIWVGTPEGLFRFDRAEESFENYHGKYIFAIYEDNQGTLWVSAMDDMYQYDPDMDKLVHWAFAYYIPVFAIHESKDGYMWFGSAQGLVRYDSNQPAGENITQYLHGEQNPNSISDNYVTRIVEDQIGNLWVGTASGGVNRLSLTDPDNDVFDRYLHIPDDAHSLSNNIISSMVIDPSGNLWVGTLNGLNLYQPLQNRFIHFDSREFSQMFSGIILKLFVDRSGLLWVGSVGALDKLNVTVQRFKPYPEPVISDNTILAGLKDQNGDQWFGTFENGLYKIDQVSQQIHHFQHNHDNPNSLSQNTVRVIFQDQQGTLWIGTEYGLSTYDPTTESFIHDPRFSGYTITTIYEDSTGRLWVGTSRGVFNSLRTIRRFSQLRPGYMNEYVFDIEGEQGGNVWLGTIAGLYLVDETGLRLAHYAHSAEDPQSLSHDWVNEVYKDSNGELWVGTAGGGVDHFNGATETFTHYTEADGLSSDMVYCILEDAGGNLWIGTDRGVTKFNPATQSFNNYDNNDGLGGDEVLDCLYQDQDEMVFAGLLGLNLLTPGSFQDNTHIPPIVITAFNKFNQTVKTDLSNEDFIQLAYDDNFISFEFAALDYVHPEKNQYAYKMEGLDEDWVYAKTRRFADYPDLKPGEYTFRVIGSNNDGTWNETGTAVHITVTSPVWQTWWFWSLIGLGLIAIVYSGYHLRVRSLQNRSRELEKQVIARTLEIDQSRQEIEALYRADEELHRHLEVDHVLQALVDTALEILQADKGTLMAWDEARENLKVRVSRGFSTETLPLITFTPGQSIAGKVGKTGETAIIEDTEMNPEVTQKIVRAEGIRSFIQVPITIDEEIFGVFSADFTQPHQFTKEEVRVLISLAQRAALAIENARLYEQAQELGILKERNRLARDLHDSVTQSMYSVTMYADAASKQLSGEQPEAAANNLDKLRSVVKEALRDLRLLIFELRPQILQKEGLVAAIEARLDAVENRSGVQIDFVVEGRNSLPFHVEDGFYRITLEALTNALKHAQAENIRIGLQFEQKSALLEIQDDGIGFDPTSSPETGGMGIHGMTERANEMGAEFFIESSLGQGTKITAKVERNNASA